MATAMVMVTETMDSQKPTSDRLSGERCRLAIGKPFPHILLSTLILSGSASGQDWRIIPFVSLQESYSDNIALAPSGAEDDAFVTALGPGVSVNHLGPRWRFNLTYQMQNLFYAGTSVDPQINNQLQMNSNTEILEKSVFLDSRSSIGQANVNSAGRLAVDNVSRTGNTTEYRTFTLSPYWRPHLGGYVEGEVRATYSTVGNSGTDISNSNIFQEQAYFQNGSRFDFLGWRANFNNQDILYSQENNQQGTSNDVHYQNYNGELSYRLANDYGIFVQAGNFNNDFQGSAPSRGFNNGAYVTPGVAWIPSQKFSLAGGYGLNNWFASVRWCPSQRTLFYLSYRDSEVGGASSYQSSASQYSGSGTCGGISGVGQSISSGTSIGGLGSGAFGGAGIGGFGMGGLGGAGTGGFGVGGLGGAGIGGLGLGGLGGAGIGGLGLGGFSGVGVGGFGQGAYGGTGLGAGGFGQSYAAQGYGQAGYASPFGQLGGWNSGPTWNGLFQHRTRRTIWNASYTVSLYTIQQTLLSQQVFNAIPSAPSGTLGVPVPNPRPIDLQSFTNEVISSKRGQVSVSGFTAKSALTLAAYQENRRGQTDSVNDQDVWGLAAIWNWQFTRRTISTLQANWQQIENLSQVDGSTKNELSYISLGLSRLISPDVFGYLEFRHLRQDSDIATTKYDENRVTASVNVRF
jgi:hypothetical protein